MPRDNTVPATASNNPPDNCDEELVRPALTYARESDPLLAIPAPSLRPNRPWHIRIFHTEHYPQPVVITLTCISIFLNALTANGVYAWPQYGPVVIKKVGFNLSQGQSIVVVGIMGLYLMAAPLGRLCDLKGPRFAALLSTAMSFIGYQAFALILAKPDLLPFLVDEDEPNGLNLAALSTTLSIAFAFVGAAGVGSYFGALTTASLSFPRYPTLALSLPLACIGLSSLALSSIGRLPVFQHAGELDAIKYIRFLGILVPGTNLFASLFMNVLPSEPLETQVASDAPGSADVEAVISPTSPGSMLAAPAPAAVPRLSYPDAPEHLLNPSEHTPLLIGGPEALYSAAREEEEEARKISIEHGVDVADEEGYPIVHHHWNVKKLLKDPGLWFFGVMFMLAVGPGEMTLASIGAILSSILADSEPAPHDNVFSMTFFGPVVQPSALQLRYKHILFLSMSSTIARLITGVVADYLSPIVLPPHATTRKTVKRTTMTAICVAVCTVVYLLAVFAIKTEARLWIISLGIGAMYGALFTLIPAITSRHYGPAHFGLAFGLLSYFAALGSTLFSYMYAFLSEYIAAQQQPGKKLPECRGSQCFQPTYAVSAVCGVVAIVGMLIVGRKWNV